MFRAARIQFKWFYIKSVFVNDALQVKRGSLQTNEGTYLNVLLLGTSLKVFYPVGTFMHISNTNVLAGPVYVWKNAKI
jgi:hypothetical protein